MFRFVILFCVMALAKGLTTVSKCVNSNGTLPISADVKGCTTTPCLLPQLQDAEVEIAFEAPYEIKRLKTLLTAYLSLGPIVVTVPYDLGVNAETCNFLTEAHCPVVEGQLLLYTLTLYVDKIFPVGTKVTAEIQVVDDNDVPVLCFRLPIKFTAPLVA